MADVNSFYGTQDPDRQQFVDQLISEAATQAGGTLSYGDALNAARNVGISEEELANSVRSGVVYFSQPIAEQFGGVPQQMIEAGIAPSEVNAFLQAEQARLDEFEAQFKAGLAADNDAFTRAQSEIRSMIEAEQSRLLQERTAYEQRLAAQQAATDAAEAEAAAEQERINAQIAETKRLAEEMAKRNRDEMEAMQRKSAAKIASSQKAGRTAADRSLLAGYGAAPGMPAVLGVQGSMSSGGSLGTGGTLGVGS